VTVVNLNKPLNEILDIVHEIKADGYRQGMDFDFAYQPPRWDAWYGDIPSVTAFIFYTEELSLFFVLKYTN